MPKSSSIKVAKLSKQYRIGQRQKGYKTFREAIIDTVKSPLRLLQKLGTTVNLLKADSEKNTIWALKEVSFEVGQGDVVGVIGKNGAGKSTLLKILSKITEPTSGRIELQGRVGSLLEVGTGFHPELTGHENIYLYGAILGMDRWEVTNKFDSIVGFAELEEFIDTPVKRYSSGMYMRLAFAVAAHLETEILLVDEVLAVGDAAFQKKCLGKMEAVTKEGRTVLFVSHNMSAIKSLCSRTILLDNGRLIEYGDTSQVINKYFKAFSLQEQDLPEPKNIKSLKRTKGSGRVITTTIALLNENNAYCNSFAIWEPVIAEMAIQSKSLPEKVSLWLLIYATDGTIKLSTFQYDSMPPINLVKKVHTVKTILDPNILTPGLYSVSVGIFGPGNEFYDWVDGAASLEIRPEFRSGKSFDGRLGETSLQCKWEFK